MGQGESYAGWSNRETWAFMLHVNNDPWLCEEFRTVASESEATYTAQDAVREYAESLLNPSEYRAQYGEARPEAVEMMAWEVGSLWRVNWSEVVESLLED